MRKIIGWILSILLAVLFLLSAGAKLTSQAVEVSTFASVGYPLWFMTLIGVLEVIAALAILVPRTVIWGAALMMCIMVGAIVSEAVHGTIARVAVPVVVLVLAILAGSLRRPVAAQTAARR